MIFHQVIRQLLNVGIFEQQGRIKLYIQFSFEVFNHAQQVGGIKTQIIEAGMDVDIIILFFQHLSYFTFKKAKNPVGGALSRMFHRGRIFRILPLLFCFYAYCIGFCRRLYRRVIIRFD